ncbi:hypothetical protein BJV78DRAFT_829004 [Lactifluus subvellereus]|nr:hypothetical protein BJV78DRAFT_829004 [Lactifluus subvellereus]
MMLPFRTELASGSLEFSRSAFRIYLTMASPTHPYALLRGCGAKNARTSLVLLRPPGHSQATSLARQAAADGPSVQGLSPSFTIVSRSLDPEESNPDSVPERPWGWTMLLYICSLLVCNIAIQSGSDRLFSFSSMTVRPFVRYSGSIMVFLPDTSQK